MNAKLAKAFRKHVRNVIAKEDSVKESYLMAQVKNGSGGQSTLFIVDPKCLKGIYKQAKKIYSKAP